LLDATNPVVTEDVTRVLRSEIEELGDEEEAPSEQLFSWVEIRIRSSSTSTVGVEE